MGLEKEDSGDRERQRRDVGKTKLGTNNHDSK